MIEAPEWYMELAGQALRRIDFGISLPVYYIKKIFLQLCRQRFPQVIMSSAASNTKKNILILGSTGPLGALTTLQALDHHFKITIFVRSPEKLAREIKDNQNITVSRPQLE